MKSMGTNGADTMLGENGPPKKARRSPAWYSAEHQ